MIYIENTTDAQTLRIPNHGIANATGSAVLRIYSTVNHAEILSVGIELVADGHFYYETSVTLPEGLENGEYEYILEQENGTLSNGLVQIGEYTRATRESEGRIEFNQL